MVSSEGNGRADVWSAEASLNCEDVDAPADEDGGMDGGDDDEDEEDVAELFATIMDAVAMDNRERTRSSGYVVPERKERKVLNETKKNARLCGQVRYDEQTEVMPARAPLASRVGVSNCFFPFEVNH